MLWDYDFSLIFVHGWSQHGGTGPPQCSPPQSLGRRLPIGEHRRQGGEDSGEGKKHYSKRSVFTGEADGQVDATALREEAGKNERGTVAECKTKPDPSGNKNKELQPDNTEYGTAGSTEGAQRTDLPAALADMDDSHKDQRGCDQHLRTRGNGNKNLLGITERRIKIGQDFAGKDGNRRAIAIVLPQFVGIGNRLRLDEDGRKTGRFRSPALVQAGMGFSLRMMVGLLMSAFRGGVVMVVLFARFQPMNMPDGLDRNQNGPVPCCACRS